jgi:hypothetical protein
MKILTILISGLAWLLAACTTAASMTPQIPSETPKASVNTTKSLSPISTPQPNQISTEILANTSTPTQTASVYCEKLLENYHPADGYQTYCDKDYGFAFDYPDGWRITFVAGSPDTSNPIETLKTQRFGANDMSNYIRVDTFRNSDSMSLTNQVHSFFGYDYREFPNNDYPSLILAGQKAHAIMDCWQQDYNAVYLFFQHGKYYTIMELKAISREGLDTNWQIARSLQTAGSTPDQNVIPQELIDDSNQLLECNAPTPTPLTPLLPTWTVTPAGASNLDLARYTLLTFFTLLHDGRYSEAMLLYGGDYDTMRERNPEIPPEDYAALWQAACTRQSPCLLVANVVDEKSIAQDEFEFVVEFVWIDGTLFRLGPCCGATEAEIPPVWQFPYTVKKVDGMFKVMEEPVYVP